MFSLSCCSAVNMFCVCVGLCGGRVSFGKQVSILNLRWTDILAK